MGTAASSIFRFTLNQIPNQMPGKNRPDLGKAERMPEVSIIVNCFNEAQYVRETLDSAFAQSFQDWEIIFWDNASVDDSARIAASYGERVRCFSNETNIPLSQARNRAFKMAQGQYFAILDADDIWLPDKLERQLELFKADPRVGMVYCHSTFFDASGDRSLVFDTTPPHRGEAFGHLLAQNFVLSSSMMFRREALDKLEFIFDERYTRVADYDLTLRMAYQGLIDYVDAPLSRCRVYSLEDKPWKKGMVSRPAEAKWALGNLVSKYPDIATRYGDELNSFLVRLEYLSGVGAWETGNFSEARVFLRGHLNQKKFALVYFCTFFLPYGWFANIRDFYRSNFTNRILRMRRARRAA